MSQLTVLHRLRIVVGHSLGHERLIGAVAELHQMHMGGAAELLVEEARIRHHIVAENRVRHDRYVELVPATSPISPSFPFTICR